ncbi:MAG: AzlD domain-containing protein [Alphaproteobacteria bacterium]|nr:AzlD domain-containing protein [Alphaproteobacteria bacterium]
MSIDPLTLAAILAMGAVTYLTRFAGFWLVRRLTLRGRLAAALEAVPGAILISVIAPAAFATGIAESAAAAAALGVALLRGPMLLAVAASVAAVLLLRAVL